MISAAGREMARAADANRYRGRQRGRRYRRLYRGQSRGDCRRQAVAAWCLAHTVDEIVSALVEADIPVAPVKTIPQVAEDPHLWEREMLVKMEDPVAGEMYLPGATIKMSKTQAASARCRPPASTPTRCSPKSSATTGPPWRSCGTRR